MKFFDLRLAAVTAITFLFAVFATAQNASTGKLVGTITDQTGASVPGIHVKLTNRANNSVRDVVTGNAGVYEFPLLPPGPYRIEVRGPGFKTAAQNNLTINVTETENLPIQLTVGETNETITVSTQPELLQTENGGMGQVVSERQIVDLPLVTRNFTQILGLSAGVNQAVTNAADIGRGSLSSDASNPRGGKYVHGSRPEDNNFQINGIQVNDQFGGGVMTSTDLAAGLPIPNPDTLQEFKVQTTQFDASYGRNSGAQINIITKGGSNKFRGTVWEFFRNEDMNANDYFRKLAGQQRGLLRQNQFGAALGGPIVQNKLQFFGSYQGTKQTNGIAAGCQASSFSPLLTNDRSAAALGALFAGKAGAFGGTTVAANGSNINPVALEILQLKGSNGQYVMPTPQTTVTVNGNQQGFSTFSVPCTYNENQFVSDADYIQSSKSILQARFFWLNSQQITSFSGSTVPGFGFVAPNKFRNGSLAHTFTFTPRLVNEVIAGLNDTTAHNKSNGNATSWNALGIPTPLQGSSGFGISISGAYVLDSATQQDFEQFDTNLVDSLSYSRGAHNFRIGGGVTREHIDISTPILPNLAAFQSFPDFLLGLPAGSQVNGGNGTAFSNEFSSQVFSTNGTHAFREWDTSAFFQDDWKLTKTFTVNLGTRYEHLGDYTDVDGRISSFNVTQANPSAAAPGSLSGLVVNNNFPGATLPAGVTRSGQGYADLGQHRNTVSPRAGFAFAATPNVVIRGGYGLFYSVPNAAQLFNTSNGQPWATNSIDVGPANAAQSLQNPFPSVPPPSALPIFQPYYFGASLSIVTLDPHFRPAVNQVFSLNQQTAFTPNLLFELAYVGARGEHLFQPQSLNSAGFATAATPIRGITTNTVANITSRVPIEGFNATGISSYGSEGASWYHGLETTLIERTTRHLQFQVAYTWSKTTDTNAPTTGTTTAMVDNPDNLLRRYGPASYDRRNRVSINYVYDLPVLHSKALMSEIFISGWQLAGDTTFQSGTPLSLVVTNASNYSGYTSNLANVSCPASKLVNRGNNAQKVSASFNLSCIVPFPVVDPSGATGFGNSPVGAITGPGQDNYDVALVKRTPVKFPSEAANVEFRVEAFNAFNHTQLSSPGVSGSSAPIAGATTSQAATSLGSTFGTISSTSVSPRVLQLALKYNF